MAKRGRPTVWNDDYIKIATTAAAFGATHEQIAAHIGVHLNTFKKWMKEKEELMSSVKKAKDEADLKVVESLYKRATSGETTACIFWLKNRQKDQWRDKQEREHTGPDGGPIAIVEERIVKTKADS